MGWFHRKITCAIPRLWLFTDPRIPAHDLLRAVRALPSGAAIIFRHYDTEPDERRALFDEIRLIARRKRLFLVLAGNWQQALRWGADGWHSATNRSTYGGAKPLLRSSPAHSARAMLKAARSGADCVFLSPAFATRSHPGKPAMGPIRFALIARRSPCPVLALGGMTQRRSIMMVRLGAYGWGAIDALSDAQGAVQTHQNLKMVPT